MIINNSIQGTDAWFESRLGIPTASRFSDIVTTKGVPSKSAGKYMQTLAGERLTGKKEEGYTSAPMQRGIMMEEEARQYFEMVKDVQVEQVGLIYKDTNKDRACSPDGLLEDAGVEIKCPNLSTHVGYLLAGKLPSTYFAQVHGSMYITGFKSWWFVSYYPGMVSLIIEIERDETFCNLLDLALDNFCLSLDDMTDKLRSF